MIEKRLYITRAVITILILLVGTSTAFSQTATDEAPLYERLGGLTSIALVVSDFVDEFIKDPIIMENRAVREKKTPDTAPYVKYQVTTLVCQVTGGPCHYQGKDMKQAHDGLNVTGREWDRMVVIFTDVLAEHRVPETETQELLMILDSTRDDIVVAETQ